MSLASSSSAPVLGAEKAALPQTPSCRRFDAAAAPGFPKTFSTACTNGRTPVLRPGSAPTASTSRARIESISSTSREDLLRDRRTISGGKTNFKNYNFDLQRPLLSSLPDDATAGANAGRRGINDHGGTADSSCSSSSGAVGRAAAVRRLPIISCEHYVARIGELASLGDGASSSGRYAHRRSDSSSSEGSNIAKDGDRSRRRKSVADEEDRGNADQKNGRPRADDDEMLDTEQSSRPGLEGEGVVDEEQQGTATATRLRDENGQEHHGWLGASRQHGRSEDEDGRAPEAPEGASRSRHRTKERVVKVNTFSPSRPSKWVDEHAREGILTLLKMEMRNVARSRSNPSSPALSMESPSSHFRETPALPPAELCRTLALDKRLLMPSVEQVTSSSSSSCRSTGRPSPCHQEDASSSSAAALQNATASDAERGAGNVREEQVRCKDSNSLFYNDGACASSSSIQPARNSLKRDRSRLDSADRAEPGGGAAAGPRERDAPTTTLREFFRDTHNATSAEKNQLGDRIRSASSGRPHSTAALNRHIDVENRNMKLSTSDVFASQRRHFKPPSRLLDESARGGSTSTETSASGPTCPSSDSECPKKTIPFPDIAHEDEDPMTRREHPPLTSEHEMKITREDHDLHVRSTTTEASSSSSTTTSPRTISLSSKLYFESKGVLLVEEASQDQGSGGGASHSGRRKRLRSLLQEGGSSGSRSITKTVKNGQLQQHEDAEKNALMKHVEQHRPQVGLAENSMKRPPSSQVRLGSITGGDAPWSCSHETRHESLISPSRSVLSRERSNTSSLKRTATTHQTTLLPPLPTPLWMHIASFLQFEGPIEGMVYVCGGRNHDEGPLATCEMFDSWHGNWVELPRMRKARAGCAACSIKDVDGKERILVTGGYDELGIVEGLLSCVEAFTPHIGTWMSRTPMLRPRWGHGAACIRNRVYVVGGCSLHPRAPALETFMETLRACELYDPETEEWTELAALSVGRAGGRVTSVADRYVLIVGGCDDVFGRAEMLASIEILDTWDPSAWFTLDVALSEPRTTAAVVSIDDRIIVLGGAPNLSSVEIVSDVSQRIQACLFECRSEDDSARLESQNEFLFFSTQEEDGGSTFAPPIMDDSTTERRRNYGGTTLRRGGEQHIDAAQEYSGAHPHAASGANSASRESRVLIHPRHCSVGDDISSSPQSFGTVSSLMSSLDQSPECVSSRPDEATSPPHEEVSRPKESSHSKSHGDEQQKTCASRVEDEASDVARITKKMSLDPMVGVGLRDGRTPRSISEETVAPQAYSASSSSSTCSGIDLLVVPPDLLVAEDPSDKADQEDITFFSSTSTPTTFHDVLDNFGRSDGATGTDHDATGVPEVGYGDAQDAQEQSEAFLFPLDPLSDRSSSNAGVEETTVLRSGNIATSVAFENQSDNDQPDVENHFDVNVAAHEAEAGHHEASPSSGADKGPSLSQGRMGSQAVALDIPVKGSQFPARKGHSRRTVLILGGEDGGDYETEENKQFRSIELLDAERLEYTLAHPLPPMLQARTAMSCCIGKGLAGLPSKWSWSSLNIVSNDASPGGRRDPRQRGSPSDESDADEHGDHDQDEDYYDEEEERDDHFDYRGQAQHNNNMLDNYRDSYTWEEIQEISRRNRWPAPRRSRTDTTDTTNSSNGGASASEQATDTAAGLNGHAAMNEDRIPAFVIEAALLGNFPPAPAEDVNSHRPH
ncbi:unnamed protein product [Amoebophrya sp. A25]|nr:unnamed protein product [Amoebophrya sp. A25]|eukprot:GSA25T00018802001.1